jgi:hypothetical protein
MKPYPNFFVLPANEAHVGDVWAGESIGKNILAEFVARVPKLEQDFVVVDLNGIAMITASAFRACLRGLREYIGGTFQKATVFANAAPETLEEAEFVASKYGDVYLFAELRLSKLLNVRLVGDLDPTLLDTLDLLALNGECDAKTLFDLRQKPGVTAWHNRLTDLAGKGLVTVRTEGRSRRFRSLLQGASHGHRVHPGNV